MARITAVVLAAALAATCARTPPGRRAVEDAAEALGGVERIRAVRTITMEGGGTNGALGGSVTPEAPPNTWGITDYRRTIDLENGRARLEQVRTARFEFANATVVRQDQRLDGGVAFNVPPEGQGAPQRANAAAAAQRRYQALEHPVVLVRAALDPMATIGSLREEHGERHIDITTASGETLTLGLDPVTSRPSRVSRRDYDPNWGDVVVETVFADYESVDGLQLPRRLTTKTDRFVTADIALTRNSVDLPAGDLAAPASVTAAPDPQPPAINVTVVPAGRGIWWLAGGSHHSVVFEFDDHLAVFEVPLDDARTQAVIARARELVPGKPLTHAVVSHHHLDHAGGFRAAVAEGLVIVTHRGNEAFLAEIAARPHTLRQDALARSGRAPRFQLVDDELALRDGTNEVILYTANGNVHAGLLLFGWVPRDRTLVQADFYDANWLQHPWGGNFVENIAARKLSPARHLPIHGRIQTHAEVLQTLASKARSAPPAAE